MPENDHPFKAKLDDIHSRLMGQPSADELQELQLHLDALATWDRLMLRQLTSHDHDHMDDHDHTQ
ncbi:hypothetical protein J5X84_01675 [Streptosporangiaceae bacterium NEAU-GS5]|nr:hypothetical protein [Streptosporangiaceae bacterium NEAU-GS5]